MKISIYTFVVFFIVGCTFGSEGSEKIIKRLESEGKPYFVHLVTTQKYDQLLDKIENGDDYLIRASSVLTQWVDASTSLSLRFSLSRAMTKNPGAVMSLVPNFFSIPELCTIPYIEPPIDLAIKHINDSISALSSYSNSNGSYIKCINIYKEISKNITKSSSGR